MTFKELEQHWYDLLKQNGFDDLEDTSRSGRPLKSWHDHKFKHVLPSVSQLADDYYRAAEHLLLTYQFKSERDRLIWFYHSQGISKRKIARLLTISNHGAIGSDAVYKIIRKIADTIKKEHNE